MAIGVFERVLEGWRFRRPSPFSRFDTGDGSVGQRVEFASRAVLWPAGSLEPDHDSVSAASFASLGADSRRAGAVQDIFSGSKLGPA